MSFLTITATKPHSWAGCEPQSNDERRGEWAAKFYAEGYHHPEKHLTDSEPTDKDIAQ